MPRLARRKRPKTTGFATSPTGELDPERYSGIPGVRRARQRIGCARRYALARWYAVARETGGRGPDVGIGTAEAGKGYLRPAETLEGPLRGAVSIECAGRC